MENFESPFVCHVFVCTNQKPDGRECCALKNGAELHAQLKEWSKGTFGKRVRINKSGCLDFCSRGVAVAIYPQNEWYLDAKLEDLEAMKAKISAVVQKTDEKN